MVSIMSVNSAAGTTGRTARQEQTVFGIFGSLLRRKSWVLLPTFLAFALALGYVISTPPAYRAEATLLVEPQETPFTRPQSSDSTERLAIDREAVASQVQVIKSLDVANLVIDELKLMELPEFNPALRPAGILDIVTSLLGSGASKDDERKAVLREYFEHLTVYPVNETRVITIAFWSHDDELSAAAANAIANAYLKVQRDNTARATTDARGWLERQITDLRARVAEAERAVELYRTEKGLFAAAREPGDAGQPAMTIQAQQLAELSTQLSQGARAAFRRSGAGPADS